MSRLMIVVTLDISILCVISFFDSISKHGCHTTFKYQNSVSLIKLFMYFMKPLQDLFFQSCLVDGFMDVLTLQVAHIHSVQFTEFEQKSITFNISVIVIY